MPPPPFFILSYKKYFWPYGLIISHGSNLRFCVFFSARLLRVSLIRSSIRVGLFIITYFSAVITNLQPWSYQATLNDLVREFTLRAFSVTTVILTNIVFQTTGETMKNTEMEFSMKVTIISPTCWTWANVCLKLWVCISWKYRERLIRSFKNSMLFHII